MSVPEIEDNEDMPKPVKGNTDEFDKKTQMYLDERKMLVDAEQAQAQSFDKGILTLSAGALGLSIAFIKDVNPKIASCSEWWIIFSWGCYIFLLQRHYHLF